MACGEFSAAEKWRHVGDPVDVVTGAHVDRMLDFMIDGPFPIEWWRYYDSRWTQDSRGVGRAHRHAFDHQLIFDLDGIVYTHPGGTQAAFPHLAEGAPPAHDSGFTLEAIAGNRFLVQRHAEPTLEFQLPDDETHARLIRLHEPHGSDARRTIALQYDRYGRLSGLAGPDGVRLSVGWDESGRVEQVALASSDAAPIPLIQYIYDGESLVEGIDAYGKRFSFTYDRHHRIATRTDRRGFTFHWEFDAAGRCVRNYGDEGLLSVTLTYKPLERQTHVVDANGAEWIYEYTADGVITSVIDPYGGRRRFDVAADGALLSEYDERGAETGYRFDDAGAPIAKITPDGDTRLMPMPVDAPVPRSHYIPSTPIEWELGDLRELDFRLPARGERIEGLPPVVDEVLTKSPDARRGHAELIRDIQGLLVREEIEEGAPRSYGYNAAGGLRRFTDHDGGVWRWGHASWNHVVSEIDPLGHETTYEYSLTEQVAAAVDPSGVRSEYAYDLKDRLVEVRRGGAVRESYTYDETGNPIETRGSKGETRLAMKYDDKGHLVSRTLASGETHSFEYDGKGRYVVAKTRRHGCTFAYDVVGRRIQDKRDGLGVEREFAGRHLTATTVLGRFRTEYRHKPDGGVVLVDPTGAEHRLVSHGNGVFTREFHDGFSETVQYHPRKGQVLCKALWSARRADMRWMRRYGYNGEGDLQSVADTERGSTTYKYDAAHRLSEAIGAGGEREHYEYTVAGSLLRAPGLDGRVVHSNRLERANGNSFEYDDRHHVRTRSGRGGVWQYERDSRDQLIRAEWTDAAGGRREFRAEYDPLARRVRTESAERGETQYYWDTDRLAAEVFADGATRIYVYPDAVAMVPMLFIDYAGIDADPAAGRRQYVLTDQRGCPERILDDEGTVIWQAKVDPYGRAAIEIGADLHQPVRFPGHWYDAETRLHYNRFRYYDPEIGRYIESDPLGLGGGLNVYAYTANPLVEVDVLGLNCESVIYVRDNPDGSRTILEIAPIPGTGPNFRTRTTVHSHIMPGSTTVILGGQQTGPGRYRGGIVVEQVMRPLPESGRIVPTGFVSNDRDLIRVANHHADQGGGMTNMRRDNSPHWRTAQDGSMRLETEPNGHAPTGPRSADWDGEGPHVAVLQPREPGNPQSRWNHTDKYFIRDRDGFANGRNRLDDPDGVFTHNGPPEPQE